MRGGVAAGLLLIALGVVIAVYAASGDSGDPVANAVDFPHERVGDIDKDHFPEPSGIVYHPGRGTLFVVSDEGHVEEIKTDGTRVKLHKGEAWRDYEGITCDPTTGLVYVAVEGEEKILELDPETLETKREFAVERTFNGKTVIKPGGDGIEDITFVPDAKHRQGGTFYVCNQVFNLKEPDDLSAVFEVELPLKTADKDGLKGRILRYIAPNIVDLAGLCYEQATGRLFVLGDSRNVLLEMTTGGEIKTVYKFPGRDQEGIAIAPDDHVYVAQDSGGIIKLKWLRKKDEGDKKPEGGSGDEKSTGGDKTEDKAD